MNGATYYNENDPFAAAWLKELMREGLITDGEVDSRSIVDVRADDLKGFARCHFFAGIGGWDYALQLAGWPADRPVWTGSCPCQPFSAAGKRKGVADARHLWPDFQRLIAECGPSTVFGEQVASKDGRIWLAGIRADLEALGYGVGAADLCAAGAGSPHIRQRLFWVADAERDTRNARRLADQPAEGVGAAAAGPCFEPGRCGVSGIGLGNADDTGPQGRQFGRNSPGEWTPWASSVVIPCADGKHRRIPASEAAEPEPALFPLAHGVPNRVGTLRGAGNAIVPQIAAEFIQAFLETERG